MFSTKMKIAENNEKKEENHESSKDYKKRLYACDHENCHKRYNYKWHLIRHKREKHDKPAKRERFICDICQEDYKLKQSLRRHIIKKHMQKYPFQCKFCSRGFEKDTLLAAHEYFHTGEKRLKCLYCDKKFDNQTARYKHQRNHKKFTCNECNIELMRWKDMLKHKKTHIRDKYECAVCQKVFTQRPHIIRHLRNRHPLFEKRPIFKCSLCPKYYNFKGGLTYHMKNIHFEFRFNCTYPDCDAKLCSKRNLQVHIDRIHNKIPVVEKIFKPRKKRKDTGIPKRSTAVKLAGEFVSLKDEKLIISESEKCLHDAVEEKHLEKSTDIPKSDNLINDQNVKKNITKIIKEQCSISVITRNEKNEDITNVWSEAVYLCDTVLN